MRLNIYTDGACKGNPGPGAWAFLIFSPSGKKLSRSGFEKETTNNRMELSAAINALEFVKKHSLNSNVVHVTLHSDSKYVVDGSTQWLKNWVKNNWNSSSGPVKNQDLWEKMYWLLNTDKLKITFVWVKGHNGHTENEEVDKLATSTITDNGY